MSVSKIDRIKRGERAAQELFHLASDIRIVAESVKDLNTRNDLLDTADEWEQSAKDIADGLRALREEMN